MDCGAEARCSLPWNIDNISFSLNGCFEMMISLK